MLEPTPDGIAVALRFGDDGNVLEIEDGGYIDGAHEGIYVVGARANAEHGATSSKTPPNRSSYPPLKMRALGDMWI